MMNTDSFLVENIHRPLQASLCELPTSLFELRRDKTTRQAARGTDPPAPPERLATRLPRKTRAGTMAGRDHREFFSFSFAGRRRQWKNNLACGRLGGSLLGLWS